MGNEASCVALGLKAWKAQLERADNLVGSLSSDVLRILPLPNRPARRRRRSRGWISRDNVAVFDSGD